MVGVPGRSKACHNCRQRRIRCDGELPSCRNCAKSKRICGGYQRQHSFILWKDLSDSKPWLPTDGVLDFCESGPGKVMVSRWRIDRSEEDISAASSSIKNHRFDREKKHPTLMLDISTRNIFRDRFFALFTENDLSGDDAIKLAFGERSQWMLQVINLPSLTPTLENALLAICTARLGRHAGQPALVFEGLKLYTKSLSDMRRCLLDDSKQDHAQGITAGMALLVYEVTECPGGTPEAYLAHYRGTMQLLKVQGPGAYTSGLAHSVFQLLRLHAVFLSFVESKKSFLADSNWKAIPWSSEPSTKAPFDHLIDILLDIPGLSDQRLALRKTRCPEETLSNALETIREGQKIESDLGHWFAKLKSASPGPLYCPKLSKLDSVVDTAELGKLFPVAFHFPAFIVGQNMIYFWVAVMSVQAHLCFVYSMVAHLIATLESTERKEWACNCNGNGNGTYVQNATPCLQHFTMQSLPALGCREEWPRTAAYNICQSIEYFLQGGQGGFGPAAVMPALALVKGFWKDAPGDWRRQIAWVNDMLDRVRTRGNGIAKVLG